jgi:hypothetical protein
VIISRNFKNETYGDGDDILQKSSNRKEGNDYVDKPLYSLINDLFKN